MNIHIDVSNPEAVRFRVTLILLIALFSVLAVSIVVFLLTEQWTRRVLFFPEANSKKYAAEVRYLPNGGSAGADIRELLEDLLLGPSNFGNARALPEGTRLSSAMLTERDLYVGFSKGIHRTEGSLSPPREMLQGVANTLYFNFPWIENVHFFIGGQELTDDPARHLVDRKFDLARSLAPLVSDYSALLDASSRHPLWTPAEWDRNIYTFHNGAKWNEGILK